MPAARSASLDVLILYNTPALAPDDPDYASEAGVLESVAAVEAALAEFGHRPRHLSAGTLEELLTGLTTCAAPDVVFNLFEGFGGVGRGEAVVAGLVELLGYPLTGSRAQCLDLVRDKARTKWLLAGAGLPTAPFELVAAGEPLCPQRLEQLLSLGPAIVKPAQAKTPAWASAARVL